MASQEISPQQVIAKRAYRIWDRRERSGVRGTPECDWLQAERELDLFPPYVELAAYYYWLARERRGTPGTPEEDWIEAQRNFLAYE